MDAEQLEKTLSRQERELDQLKVWANAMKSEYETLKTENKTLKAQTKMSIRFIKQKDLVPEYREFIRKSGKKIKDYIGE